MEHIRAGLNLVVCCSGDNAGCVSVSSVQNYLSTLLHMILVSKAESGMYRYDGNWCIEPKMGLCCAGFTVYRVPVYNPSSDLTKWAVHFVCSSRKRQFIYCMMLEHMTDEHRFQLTAKVVQEVLGGIVDGIIPLDSDTSALLQDALAILCSKVTVVTVDIWWNICSVFLDMLGIRTQQFSGS